ncbi:MAG: alpha/beta fold hydrolase [Xanthobacteraceae bacterium]
MQAPSRTRKLLIVAAALVVAVLGGYVAVSKFAIRHETIDLYDAARKRDVAIDLAVRRDYAMRADAGLLTLPVAIVSHGNTVKNTEYSFLANAFAARGYLVASIQHDLPSDKPLVTQQGSLFVGRLDVYERAEQNILFAIEQLKKIQPNADYDHLTMVGHSNGGDISVYFAHEHPDLVTRIVTLDNLRVPLVSAGFAKILSFRSKDQQFKPDPGVVPSKSTDDMDIVDTGAQHTDMSDRGPDTLKERIQADLDRFLDATSKLSPVRSKPNLTDPHAMGP